VGVATSAAPARLPRCSLCSAVKARRARKVARSAAWRVGVRADWDFSCLNGSNLSKIKINHHFSLGSGKRLYNHGKSPCLMGKSW